MLKNTKESNPPLYEILGLSGRESLREISERAKTNKLIHNYEDVYEKYFERLRLETIKILEIGIWEGNSLRMWRDYFPKGQVYGFDIHSSRMVQNEERITTMVVNQNDRGTLKNAMARVGMVDIIIDDGSHVVEHQQTSFGNLFPYVKKGGYYCIEDVHTSYFYSNRIDWKKLKNLYGLSKDLYNTTYVMLKNYESFGIMKSMYMDQQELEYINQHIEEFELNVRNNFGSVTCIIGKK